MIIAVDGTAASGKGTLAKHLAEKCNLAYLDTGALYRACALALLKEGARAHLIDETKAEAAARQIDLATINDPAIRDYEVGQMASIVAAMEPVRAALVKTQRDFAHHPPPNKKGTILDGRDIGSVIVPEADCKFFVDANLDIRAQRRHQELLQVGSETTLQEVKDDLAARDARDSGRAHAPLKCPEDAIFIDTSEKSVSEMVAFALNHCNC